MKKLIAILLVLLLTASLFAGCQNEKSPATTAAPPPLRPPLPPLSPIPSTRASLPARRLPQRMPPSPRPSSPKLLPPPRPWSLWTWTAPNC